MAVVLYGMVLLRNAFDLKPRSLGEVIWIALTVAIGGGVYVVEAIQP